MAPFSESRDFSNWWRSRTNMEQRLLVLSTVLGVLSFCLIIAVAVIDNRAPPTVPTSAAPVTPEVSPTDPVGSPTDPPGSATDSTGSPTDSTGSATDSTGSTTDSIGSTTDSTGSTTHSTGSTTHSTSSTTDSSVSTTDSSVSTTVAAKTTDSEPLTEVTPPENPEPKEKQKSDVDTTNSTSSKKDSFDLLRQMMTEKLPQQYKMPLQKEITVHLEDATLSRDITTEAEEEALEKKKLLADNRILRYLIRR